MSDRTLFFLENGRAVARGLTQSADGQWVSTQDADTIYSYTLDWAGWLAGDTIADASTSGKGVTIQAFAFDDTSVTFQALAPSADGVLRVQIVASSGRIDGRVLKFAGGASSARSTVTVLATPVIPGTEWAAGVAYEPSDVVWVDGTAAYRARTAHTAGASFSADLEAGKWTLAVDVTPVTQQIDAVKLDKTGDASLATVTATGAAVARKQGERAADVVNIKDHGAKSDGSAIATSALADATADAASSGGVVHMPPGLYDLTAAPAGTQNVGYFMLGPRFRHAGPPYPDWQCEPTFYMGDAPRAWMALEGSVDRQDGQFGLYIGMRIKPTGGGPNYMKGPILAKVITHDQSGPDATTRDAVAITGQGIVASGNMLGRAWALHGVSIVEDGADGLTNGLEIDMANFNASAVMKVLNQPTSKTGIRIFASNGHTTSGIHFDFDGAASPAASMHHAISVNPAALDADGYAFRLAGLMSILADGSVGVGTDTPISGYGLHVEAAATARQLLRGHGSSEQAYQTVMVGTEAWSFGFANVTNTPFRLSKSTLLNAANFEWNEYGNFSLGGSVPAGFGANGLHIKIGSAPWLSPGTGFVLYVDAADGNKLKAMSPTGIVTTLAV